MTARQICVVWFEICIRDVSRRSVDFSSVKLYTVINYKVSSDSPEGHMQLHLARDTDSGVEALCGRLDVFAVYPSQLARYSNEAVCSECKRLHEIEWRSSSK